MTWLATPTLFGLLITVAIGSVAVAALVLGVLIVRDWRRGKLW